MRPDAVVSRLQARSLEKSTMIQFTHQFDAQATRITFPAKPSAAVRAMLKGAGFRWSSAGGFWWRRGCKGAADFIAALDRKMNPGRPDGACWRCQSPQGFFRPHGAATPVYCDVCHATLQENLAKAERGESVPRIDRFDLDCEDRCRAACGL
jgi:hypothetical protein